MAFRFAHPWALLLFAALAVGLFLWYRRMRRAESSASSLAYSDLRLVSGVPAGWRAHLIRLPDVLRLLAWCLLVIALARPQFGDVREVLRGQGIDIVLALDISDSMAALDFEPSNRLEAAKMVIADFIEGRSFDRIGLVVFARNAYHQSPLTLDYPVLLQLLDQVRLVTEIVDAAGQPLLLNGTAVGFGIASAATMLDDSDAPSKVIILLTDGENNAGIDPLLAAQAADALEIRVYTIGIGRLGQIPIPGLDGEVRFVESELNEDSLRAIAESADGLYFQAEDTDGLRRIYDEIDRLERSRVDRQVYIPWQDRAWGWLIAALVLLVSERVLRRTLFQTVP